MSQKYFDNMEDFAVFMDFWFDCVIIETSDISCLIKYPEELRETVYSFIEDHPQTRFPNECEYHKGVESGWQYGMNTIDITFHYYVPR